MGIFAMNDRQVTVVPSAVSQPFIFGVQSMAKIQFSAVQCLKVATGEISAAPYRQSGI